MNGTRCVIRPCRDGVPLRGINSQPAGMAWGKRSCGHGRHDASLAGGPRRTPTVEAPTLCRRAGGVRRVHRRLRPDRHGRCADPAAAAVQSVACRNRRPRRFDLPWRHGGAAGVRRHDGSLGQACHLCRQPAVLRRLLDPVRLRQFGAAAVRRPLPRRRRRRHGYPDQRRLFGRDRTASSAWHHRRLLAEHHVDIRRDDLEPDRVAAHRVGR